MAEIVFEYNKLADKKPKLLDQIPVIEAKARKAVDLEVANAELTLRIRSLETALEETNSRGQKLGEMHKAEMHLAILEAMSHYTKSNEFLENLVDMNKPVVSFGWTSAMDETRWLHPELNLETLEDSQHYNPKAKELGTWVL